MLIRDEDVFEYHERPRPGKLEVVTSKPCFTQRDLSLAYTPGVARASLAIADDPDAAYRFTGRGNLVAVVSNGTAVLGLGDIGPLSAKPVMEGKATLFKRFADIDVFDLELNASDPDDIVRIVKALEPTFGGVNLEDIKAPECFYIEERLKAHLQIPVFHDDQHGTAIISGAAFLNALELAGKRAEEVRVVIAGAGAAGIACADMYLRLGVRSEHLLLVDTVGVVYQGRVEKMNPYKARFAAETAARTLADAVRGADVFIGVAVAGILTPEMLRTMAPDPIVFAMANPDPEIPYEVARATRPDVILATGRSDYPNQVNNVLGFPFIFRGALDVRARAINDEMKMAATRALAALAREDVPEAVLKAYGIERLSFGPDYLIPKPFDPRVLLRVAPAVAEAAIRSGAAQRPIRDLDDYRESLERIMGPSRRVMRMVVHKAQHAEPRRIVFPDGDEPTVVRAARMIADQHIARPVLVGSVSAIEARLDAAGVDRRAVEIIDPLNSDRLADYADMLYRWRRLKGMTPARARALVRDPSIFGLMMVSRGDADGFLGGMYKPYPETIRPAIQIVGLRDGVSRVSAVNLLVLKDRLLFCADTMVNVEPTSAELAEIAILAAETARFFDVEPRIALLSFSNFGSARHPSAARVAEAVQQARERRPDLVIDGELNVETALVEEIAREHFPHSQIQGDANVLVFPDLAAGNIGYKIAHRLGKADMVGPILMGMRRPVNVLPPGASAADIVNVAAITAVAAEMESDVRAALPDRLEPAEV
ncbi:MAG TPA: NADP-dependent malic enzyme [Vicinamibacterales bacterium]|jgi:malate dehydrogenase (oxaloacetate-decarboxylating)(NADP+)|nr:NADP-dependent malic enzyme [Vicinamibacterales bacterium]